jgi:hypothetical protein
VSLSTHQPKKNFQNSDSQKKYHNPVELNDACDVWRRIKHDFLSTRSLLHDQHEMGRDLYCALVGVIQSLSMFSQLSRVNPVAELTSGPR